MKTASFIKTMGAGIVVGMVAGAACTSAMQKKSTVKNKMGKTIKNIGEVVDNFVSMF
ncbi:MAG: hypothetical protein IJC55_00935 [Clostridia bacterium]|nr:hypothetical protein [Clostridia bacterium]